MANDWDGENEHRGSEALGFASPARGWWPLLVLFAFLPLAALTGLARIEWGPRAYAPDAWIHVLLRFFFHCAVLTPVIAWPLVSGEPTWPDRPRRTALALVLLAAPLLSLAYYLGEVRDLAQGLDAAWAVVPAVGIAVAHFRRYRQATAFVLMLAVATFVPFYLVGDRLGAFHPLVAYASRGSGVYSLRVLAAVAALALAYFPPARLRRPTLSVGAGGIALAAIVAWLAARSDASAMAQLRLMACAGIALLVLPTVGRRAARD